MKRMKILIAVVLLCTLIASGFGQIAPQALASGQPAINSYIAPTNVKTDMFRAKFEGDRVSGSGEAVDGVYRFTADKTDGEAWHVKLECNYPTVAGRDYFVTYRFRSSVAGKVKFGDFQEFEIRQGENTITGIMIASSGTSYLDLQLGQLPPFTIDFTEIEVKEYADEVEYEDALETPINFERESRVYERHDSGYAPILTRGDGEVSIYYFSTAWDAGVWKSRLYVNTGLVPVMGERYRVTADLVGDADMPFEVLFNDGDREKGYGALYGQSLVANEVKHIEAVITGGEGDELILQFSLGEAPEDATLKLNNLRIEKVRDHYSNALPAAYALDKTVETGKILDVAIPIEYKTIPLKDFSFFGTDTVYEQHDGGYDVSLDESASSATLHINRAPDERNVWNVRLYAQTGVVLEAGSTYQISFDLASTASQANYEACLDGDSGDAIYGKLFRSLSAGGTDHVEHTVTPDVSHGPLTIRLQLGKTDSTAGNTVTLSNIKVIKAGQETATAQTLAAPFYPTQAESSTESGSFFLEDNIDNNGSKASLTGDGSSAAVSIQTPGQADWHTKLYIKPELDVTAGESCTFSMNVTGTSGWSAVYKTGGDEKALPSPTVSGSTYSYTFTPDGSGRLEVILKLGDLAADSSVTVSGVQVRKTTTGFTTATLTDFAYPVTTVSGTTTVAAQYQAQTVSLSANAVAWNESAADAYLDGGAAKLHITTARTEQQGGIWSIRLHAGTGITLEEGATYKVSGTVSSEQAAAFEVLYSNGSADAQDVGKGYSDAVPGGSLEAGGSQNFETEFTVGTLSSYDELIVRVQVGNSPADNTVTLSNVTVQKWIPEHQEGGESQTDSKSFFLEPNAGNMGTDAVLTGDGSSATVKVLASHDDWNIKLYANTGKTLEAGKTYRISAKVSGAGNWAICYKRAGEGENDFDGSVSFGETVVNTVTPTQSGALEVMLKLGAVEAGGSVTIRDIQVEEATVGEFDVTPESFAYPATSAGGVNPNAFELETNNGTAASLSGDGSSATATVTTPGDDWHIKLYAKTGLTLQEGKTYRISARISGADGWAICYKRAGGDEYAYNGSLAFGDAVVNTVKANETGDLEIMLKLGKVAAGGSVTMRDIKVEELSYGESTDLLPSFSYNSVGFLSKAADDGYITSLEQASDSATFHITQAPAERHPWNVKLNVRTGFTPVSGKGYRVSFDISSAMSQSAFEVFYDGDSESAYGALTGQPLAAGKRSVSYTIMPGESHGPLVLQLRFGQTNGTDGNSYTISNLKLEEVTFQFTKSPEKRNAAALAIQPGYRETLEKTRDKLTLRIEKTPKTGLEPWKSKLFIQTGTTLKAGQKYRISMVVKSVIPAPFEVCFNNGDIEKGLGAIFGLLSSPSGQRVEYVTYPKQDIHLAIQLSLGNCASPNTIMVSNVTVEKAAATYPVSDTIYTF